jgi:hypothetical protein
LESLRRRSQHPQRPGGPSTTISRTWSPAGAMG